MDLPREFIACPASLLSTIGPDIVDNGKDMDAEWPDSHQTLKTASCGIIELWDIVRYSWISQHVRLWTISTSDIRSPFALSFIVGQDGQWLF